MVLGFGSLLGSPQGRSQAEAPRPEFTPIGKRSGSTSSFQVYHSYPQEQKTQTSPPRRKLFRPLADSNLAAHYSHDSGLFDDTVEDFEKLSPIRPQRSPIAQRNRRSPDRHDFITDDSGGIAARQLEETIKELRLENYGWKIKYKELIRSLENMPAYEREVRKENIQLKEKLATLHQHIQQLESQIAELQNNKENITTNNNDFREKDNIIQQLNNKIYELQKQLSSENKLKESQLENEEIIQALKSERNELTAKVSELEDYMKHSEVEFDVVMKQNDEFQERIHELEAAIDTLHQTEATIQQQSQLRENTELQLQKLSTELDKQQEMNRLLASKNENLEMDLSEKTDNLKELNNKVLSQAQEINLLETKLDTLNSQFENNTDGNEKLMKNLELLQNKVQTQEASIDELHHEQKTIENEYKAKIKDLEYENAQLSEEILRIRAKNSQYDPEAQHYEINQLKQENTQLKDNVKKYLNNFKELKDKEVEHAHQIAFYELEFEKAEKENEKLRKEIKLLKAHESEFAESEVNNRETHRKLKEVERANKELIRKLENLQSEHAADKEQHYKELAELERVSLSKEKDLARFKAELENLQNSVSEKTELRADNVHLSNQLEASWKEIADLENQLSELRITQNQLKSEKRTEVDYEIESLIRKLKNDLTDLERENARLKTLEIENIKLKQQADKFLDDRELYSDNIELLERLKKAESARAAAEKKVSKMELDIADLQEIVEELYTRNKFSLHDNESTELKKEVQDLKNKIKASDDYIDELERNLRHSQADNNISEKLQKELTDAYDLVQTYESKMKQLEKEVEKIKQSPESSTIEQYVEFQLKLTRDELEKANAQLKSTEEKYKKEITELQTEKQNMDIELLKAKSNNKDLNRQLEALNQELSTMTRNCKRLAIKATEYRRLGKKLDNTDWIEYIQNENYYFKERYRDTNIKARDFKFLYNFTINSIRNSTEVLTNKEDNSNLAKLGIYPEYVNQSRGKRPKLTFAALAKFVLAAVRIRQRTRDQAERYRELTRVRGEVDVARLKYN